MHQRQALTVPKIDATVSADYTPSDDEITEANLAKALKNLYRQGDPNRLDSNAKA